MQVRVPSGVRWRKSSRSGNNVDCVEMAVADSVIWVRDSKDPDGPVLKLAAGTWQLFLAGVRHGDFG